MKTLITFISICLYLFSLSFFALAIDYKSEFKPLGLLPQVKGFPYGNDAIAIDEQGQFAIILNNDTCTVQALDLKSNKELFNKKMYRKVLFEGSACPNSVTISPTGKYGAVAFEGKSGARSYVNIIDVHTGETVNTFKKSTSYAPAYDGIRFSRDEKEIYIKNISGDIIIGDVLSGKVKAKFSPEDSGLTYVSDVSPDLKTSVMVMNKSNNVLIVNLKKGVLSNKFQNPVSLVTSVGFAGNYLVMGTSKGKVFILDKNGKIISEYQAHSNTVKNIYFNEKDKTIITVSASSLKSWKLDSKEKPSAIKMWSRYYSANPSANKVVALSSKDTIEIRNIEYLKPESIENFKIQLKNTQDKGKISELNGFFNKIDNYGLSEIDLYLELQDKAISYVYELTKKTKLKEPFYKFLEAYPNSHHTKNALDDLYNILENENNLASFQEFVQRQPKAKQSEKAVAQIYTLSVNDESRSSLELFIKQYSKFESSKSAISKVYELIQKQNTIEGYEDFLEQYPSSEESTESVTKIFNLIEKQNNIEGYQRFISKYSDSKLVSSAIGKIYELTKKQNKIVSYENFIAAFPNSILKNDAISSIYDIVKEQNNVAGYSWFLQKYPTSYEASDALTKMHFRAYEMSADVGTIEALNDYIIAYPTSKQIGDAEQKAYDLEKKEYAGLLSIFSKEKEARRLLIQSKIIEQESESVSANARVGYLMIVNRMNKLLKSEFDSSDATLRHLESNEFKSFVKKFSRAMNRLESKLEKIARNTSELSNLIESQTNQMDNHFNKAAKDRELAAEYTKQHRFWERYIGEVGH